MGIFDKLSGKRQRGKSAPSKESPPTVQRAKSTSSKRSRKVKPKVKKIILFWGHAPKAKEAQAIIGQLPQWHPELDFQAALAIDERLPSEYVAKCADKFNIGTIANRLVNAIKDDGGRIENYDIEGISKMTTERVLDIAAIQILEKELQKKHGFKHVDYPNRLICKVIMTKTGICHCALILDSEIDPSNYNFHTPGIKGYKLSTLFWEAANT